MPKICCRILLFASTTLSVLVAGGCGKNTSQKPEDKAEKVVELFLDAWSRGEPASKFADADNPIQGADPDWKAGSRLLSFLSTETKQRPDMPDHFLCKVSLYLQDQKGKKGEKLVVYEVQLGEKSVIKRAAQ